MDIRWVGIKCKEDESICDASLANRLKDAIQHQVKRLSSPTTKSEREFLERFPNACASLNELKPRIEDAIKSVKLPINKGGNISWDLIHSAYLFKVFPSYLTASLLSLSVKKPKASKSEKEATSIDFAAFQDDPIKLARGQRGFVFKAFTSLSHWNPTSAGQPTWKEFDIAAFKEALKSLNQFSQKTEERESTENDLRGQLAIMLGSGVEGWKPKKPESGEDSAMPKLLKTDLFQKSA